MPKTNFPVKWENSSICIQMKIGTDKQFHQTVSISNPPAKRRQQEKRQRKTFIGKIQLCSFTDFYTFLFLHNEFFSVFLRTLFSLYLSWKKATLTKHLRLMVNLSLQSLERSTPLPTLDTFIITKPQKHKIGNCITAQYSKIKMQMKRFSFQDYFK